jgi:hypothetical protein
MCEIRYRLQRRGRPEDPTFDGDEHLYKAMRSDCILERDGKRQVAPLAIKTPIITPPFEVIRGKYIYDVPRDIFILSSCDSTNHQVTTFQVKDIPESETDDDNENLNFRPIHDPSDDNYPRSYIVAEKFQNGTSVPVNALNEFVAKKVRTKIGRKLVVV